MEKARHHPSFEAGEGQEQEEGCSGSTKKQKQSPVCIIAGLVSPQECGVRTKISEEKKAELCSKGTL